MSSDKDKDRVDTQHQQGETHALQNNPSKISKQIPTGEADTYTPKGGSSTSTMQSQEQQENETQNDMAKEISNNTHSTNKAQ